MQLRKREGTRKKFTYMISMCIYVFSRTRGKETSISSYICDIHIHMYTHPATPKDIHVQTRTHTRTHIHTRDMISMSSCLYVSMSLCLYVSMSLCLYVSMPLCLYASMPLCLYAYMRACVCVCVNFYQMLIVMEVQESFCVYALVCLYASMPLCLYVCLCHRGSRVFLY